MGAAPFTEDCRCYDKFSQRLQSISGGKRKEVVFKECWKGPPRDCSYETLDQYGMYIMKMEYRFPLKTVLLKKPKPLVEKNLQIRSSPVWVRMEFFNQETNKKR
ncbi:hypothetical protein DLM78_08415 [Leptospira stimsonii]|uniref:Uncharacterized protein n=1 Tax=Leptospira stimsonii TaxID=2202203 RepID=A0A8B3CSC0_9LEPT|nr:hypothetical protein DLM78_08415 [Leptospira stimsonii]